MANDLLHGLQIRVYVTNYGIHHILGVCYIHMVHMIDKRYLIYLQRQNGSKQQQFKLT